MSKEIVSCQRKWVLVKGNNFLSKDMVSCQKKWFPVEGSDLELKLMEASNQKICSPNHIKEKIFWERDVQI